MIFEWIMNEWMNASVYVYQLKKNTVYALIVFE